MASVPFNNLITFSRGSNATLTGSNGLIQWAPNNLVPFSEQLDNASWAKTALGVAVVPVVTANAGVAPDGTSTADRVQFNCVDAGSVGNRSYISPTFSYPTGLNYVGSVWVKAFDAGNVGKTIRLAVDGVANAVFTLTADWQRILVTGLASSTVTNFIIETRGTFTTQTADALIWGAQLELGSTATTYNSTTVKNLLGYSEAFDNAAWNKSNVSIVTGAQANPVNGAFNAQKLMEDAANAIHRVALPITVASATPCTLSVYAKTNDARRLYVNLSVVAGVGALFDLSGSGSVVDTAGAAGNRSASIVSLGDGWYRCRVTGTGTGTANNAYFQINRSSSVTATDETYTGDGNSGIYIYGAQLSDSASLDPYVPTPGAAPSSTAYYGPRFDYDPVTLAPKGILVEEARTNLLTYSEDWTNAAWIKTTLTVTANASVSPDGASNADTLTNTGVGGRLTQDATAGATSSHTFSAYVKAGTVTLVTLLLRNSNTATNIANVTFNLASGVVAGVDAGTGTITNAGGGWYRCTVTSSAGVTAGNTLVSYIYPGGSGGAVGASVSTYGAQLEAGAFATSYIPTIASTVTRSADVATITGSLFSQWYGQTQGTFVINADVLAVNSTTQQNLLGLYTSATNIMRFWLWEGAPTLARFTVVDVTSQADITSAALSANTTFKAAAAYKTNDFAASYNGAAASTDTSGTVPVGFSQLNIGSQTGSFGYMNGHIRYAAYYPVRAADFQLQALTS